MKKTIMLDMSMFANAETAAEGVNNAVLNGDSMLDHSGLRLPELGDRVPFVDGSHSPTDGLYGAPDDLCKPADDTPFTSSVWATDGSNVPTVSTVAPASPTDNHTAPMTTTPVTYGYIRVSTKEQNEARQIDAMNEFGVDEIFMDKQSGKDFERPAYQDLLSHLKEGDVLVVKSIDRLGRDYDEILEQWRIITKEKLTAIVVLDMPLLDTRANRDLTGTLIADIVLQLLSYVAETERSFIRQRQKEGIAAAKARGQRLGRPKIEVDPRAYEMAIQWHKGQIGSREAGRILGVSHSTFIVWAKEIEVEGSVWVKYE